MVLSCASVRCDADRDPVELDEPAVELGRLPTAFGLSWSCWEAKIGEGVRGKSCWIRSSGERKARDGAESCEAQFEPSECEERESSETDGEPTTSSSVEEDTGLLSERSSSGAIRRGRGATRCDLSSTASEPAAKEKKDEGNDIWPLDETSGPTWSLVVHSRMLCAPLLAHGENRGGGS